MLADLNMAMASAKYGHAAKLISYWIVDIHFVLFQAYKKVVNDTSIFKLELPYKSKGYVFF